jgi:hypothetical protein
MTLTQYRDELDWLFDLQTLLIGEIEVISTSPAWSNDSYEDFLEFIAVRRQTIRSIRSVRSTLSAWFWGSRIGNPPSTAVLISGL